MAGSADCSNIKVIEAAVGEATRSGTYYETEHVISHGFGRIDVRPSAAHRDKVEAYVARGIEEGAWLRCGGARPDEPELADGFYYLPTVLDRCTSDMSVTQDESFGPVLTVESFRDSEWKPPNSYICSGLVQVGFVEAISEYILRRQLPPWVLNEVAGVPGLRVIGYVEAGWDGHQDVLSLARDADRLPVLRDTGGA